MIHHFQRAIKSALENRKRRGKIASTQGQLAIFILISYIEEEGERRLGCGYKAEKREVTGLRLEQKSSKIYNLKGIYEAI